MTIQNEQRVKQAELGKLVELAENYLAAALAMREQRKYQRQVIDLGYNAAELCAKALILAKQDVLPRRHGGVVAIWSKLYVLPGEVDKEIGRVLNRSLDWRNLSRYDPKAAIDESMVADVLEAARKLIEISKKMLEN